MTVDADFARHDAQDTFLSLTSAGIFRFTAANPIPIHLPVDEQVELIWRHGILAECNDALARMYGIASAADVVGKPLKPFLADEGGNSQALYAFVRSGYRLDGFETVEMSPSNERRHFLNSLVGVVRDGHLMEAWGSQTDITERKRREQQARQLQSMDAVSRLAGSVAHDFNNLLTTILTSAEILSDSLDEGHVGLDDVEEIRRSARQGAELTRQLLAMSRQQVLSPRATDVNALLRGVEDRIRSIFPIGTRVTVETQRMPNVAQVDPDELEQTLIHLATNAAPSVTTSGSFSVIVDSERLTTKRESVPDNVAPGDYVAIRIAHSGSPNGGSMELVLPFAGAETASLGSGLAMATIHGFMMESGGSLVFESRNNSIAYTLYFPASTPQSTRGTTVDVEVPTDGKRTVLLAEDEPTVRLLMKRVLERAGYAVLIATDGDEALAISRAYGSTIDVLVTDVIMPGMGGGELSRRVRAERPGVKVLHVSGYTAGALRHHEELEDGAAFLQKPFAAKTLMLKLKEVLAS